MPGWEAGVLSDPDIRPQGAGGPAASLPPSLWNRVFLESDRWPTQRRQSVAASNRQRACRGKESHITHFNWVNRRPLFSKLPSGYQGFIPPVFWLSFLENQPRPFPTNWLKAAESFQPSQLTWDELLSDKSLVPSHSRPGVVFHLECYLF